MRFILSSLLGVGCLLSLIGCSQSDDRPQLNIEPRFLQFSEEGRRETLVLCTLEDSFGDPIPLAGCQFKAYNFDHFWDFNLGAASPRTTEGKFLGSYHGDGLKQGECGIAIANYSTYGGFILGCRVQPASGGTWLYEKMMILASAWKPQQFNLDPPGVTLALPGSNVTFNGKAEKLIDGCEFFLPPANNIVTLDFELGSASTNYSLGHYHGAGLEQQECGVTLLKVTPALSGFVRASVHSNAGIFASSTFVELIVASSPEAPLLTVFAKPRLNPGDVVQATCVVKNSRPVANITWYVGNKVVRNDSINEAPLDSMWRWNHDSQTIVQHLKYVVNTTDDNKRLYCASSHVALTSGRQYSRYYQIRVNRRIRVTTTERPVPPKPDLCLGNPCGNNTDCESTGFVINCGCKEHFLGSPPSCRPECVTDKDCLMYRTCDGVRCVDGCDTKTCGIDAECTVERGVVECKCFDGLVGVGDIRCDEGNLPNCGKRTVTPTLNTGAQNTTIEEFPWHVGLYALIDGIYKFVCGGTLIRRNIVITAAHCVYSAAGRKVQNATELKVALGKVHRDYNEDLGSNSLQLVNVDVISVPPEYRDIRYSFEDDIAVLKLEKFVRLSSAVNVACVDWNEAPPRNRDPKWAKVNATSAIGTVAGWSKKSDSGAGSIALQWLDLVWTNKDTCYDETREESQQFITDNKFCAGFLGQNVLCQVISGAGFMVLKNEKYFLRGVVGVHLTYPEPRFCNVEHHAAFEAIAAHKDWVQSKFY